MELQLDHLILAVNDRQKSIEFYTQVLGMTCEGQREGTPFSVIRVTPEMVLQLAPFGTKGGEHLAFSVTRAEFDRAMARIRERGVEYGDSFDTVGNMRGPGDSGGAKGPGKSIYLFDPSRHLIEFICYDAA